MFLIFNHQLSQEQEKEAREVLQVEEIVKSSAKASGVLEQHSTRCRAEGRNV